MNLNPKYAVSAWDWEPKQVPSTDLTAWRSRLNLEGVEVLYVYGLGTGELYTQFVSWLREKRERQLVVLEADTGVIATVLQQQAPILFDAQVSIEWIADRKALLQELSELYPVAGIAVIALPGMETAAFQKIRLQLLRRTSLSYALFVDRLYGYRLFENFVRNVPQLERAFYANGLKQAFAGIPAIICGAGPSLKADIETLRTLEGRALIIAGGSAIAALSAAGIEPHFAIAIDPNPEEQIRLQNSFAYECPFLFSTRLCPAVFATCNGPFGYLRAGIGGAAELWLEEKLALTDPLLGEHLSDESISVTTLALAFAQHIGCSTIILSGMDLAYTGGNRYAPGVRHQTTSQTLEISKSPQDRLLRKKDKRGNFVKTAVRWVMEAASIAHFAKKHPEIQWRNATEGGLPISGILQQSLRTIEFPLQWDLRGMIAKEIALHPFPSLPSENPLPDLKQSLIRLIAQLEILAGEKVGSKALAELDMQEELAFSVLFYDMDKVLFQALHRTTRDQLDPTVKWALFLEIARNYLKVF